MGRLSAILALVIALATVYAGCSKREPVSQSAGVSERVTRSTNPAAAFTVKKEQENWWLVSPSGQKFFSMGVCVVSRGSSKEGFDPENPSYAAFQHYESPGKWAEATSARLREWEFTTVGGWSDYAELLKVRPEKGQEGLWITPVLHMGSTSGMPWWDMWDEKNIARAQEVARKVILAVRDEPRLLGYYSDNELGWWNAQLWKSTLEQPASSGQRKRLMALLREEYGGDWEKLKSDFESDVATNWEELEKRGLLYLRPGGRGILMMRRFLAVLAERYYTLTSEIIRKYDRRGLILGDRYPSFYYPEVVRAAARHVDVVSMNLNAAWEDGSFPRFQLETLYGLTNKPILVSEIYMSAAENRSGNRNSTGNFPVVKTQAERAQSARNTLERLARVP
ncbi:MAG TPA: hypothetical protein VGP94_14875, partial [Tepidisphaeraceae bacterium]|nr:hypothetical protein [Tepidisphaeraceae bacterium]